MKILNTVKFLGSLIAISCIVTSIEFFSSSLVFAETKFTDVPTEHWANVCIMEMASEGVISGYPDGTFAPDEPVSRAEFCKIVILASGRELPNLYEARTSWYAVPGIEGHWCEQYMSAMAKDTWTYREWYLTENVDPNQTINRGEAAMGIADLLYGYPRSYERSEVKAYLQARYTDSDLFGAFQNTVYEATLKGFMTGYADGSFLVQKKITRAELCSILYKVSRDLKAVTPIADLEDKYLEDEEKNENKKTERQNMINEYYRQVDELENDYEELYAWYEEQNSELLDYISNGDPFSTDWAKSIYDSYGVSNGNSPADGNLDSFAAANAMRQQAALKAKADSAILEYNKKYIADQRQLIEDTYNTKKKYLDSIKESLETERKRLGL